MISTNTKPQAAVLFLLRLSLFRKPRQALAAERLAQLDQAAGFDLTDALAGDAIALGHFVQRARLAVLQAETQLDHFPFPRRQGAEHLSDAVAKQVLIRCVIRIDSAGIVEEFAQVAL